MIKLLTHILMFLIRRNVAEPIKFAKYVIDMNKVPREFRDVFMKLTHNLYLETLEGVAIEVSDKDKIRKATIAEGILMIYNVMKTFNIIEEQKISIQEEKEKVKKVKKSSFLFGS